MKLLCIVQDATQLALKIVTNYALSDAGITTYASPGHSLGYMRKSFEVSSPSKLTIRWRQCPWTVVAATAIALSLPASASWIYKANLASQSSLS